MRSRLFVVFATCGALLSCGGDSSPTTPKPSFGVISGVVSSSLGGGVSGATVVVTPTGGSALAGVRTGSDGSYTVASVPGQSGIVVVSNLPPQCSAPQSAAYQGLSGGSTATVDIAVTCQAQNGTLIGTIKSSLGGAIQGIDVTVTPEGATALASVRTDSNGKYVVVLVPVGNGIMSVGSVPPLCHAPTPSSYSGLLAGATKIVDVTITCTPPPTGTISGTIVSSLGGGLSGVSVTITPTGSPALTPVITAANGSYSVSHVPLASGSGSVSVSNVPNWCTPASGRYSELTATTTVIANVTVSCQSTATVIAHCQTISSSGSYMLNADIGGAISNGYCLTITANDVALDCAGHTISADGTGATVALNAVERVSLHNCTVVASGSGLNTGIVAFAPRHLTIDDIRLRVTAPDGIGIVIRNGQDVALTQSTVLVTTVHYYAVYLSTTLRAQLTNNQISSNGACYVQDSSSYIALGNNVLSDNSAPSTVILSNGHNNSVTANTIDGGWKGARTPYGAQGTDDGIVLSNEDLDTVSSNTIANVWDASVEGVGLLTHTVISGNTLTNIGGAGIGSYWGTSWVGNKVADNHLAGAEVFTSILFDGNSIGGYKTVSSINFLNNTFDGNTFESPVITQYANMASIVISFAGLGQGSGGLPLPAQIGQNVISNNVLPSSLAAFYLLPTEAFLDGGGNVCDAANAGNAAFCGAGSVSTAELSRTGARSPSHRLPPFPTLPLSVTREMSRMRSLLKHDRNTN